MHFLLVLAFCVTTTTALKAVVFIGPHKTASTYIEDLVATHADKLLEYGYESGLNRDKQLF